MTSTLIFNLSQNYIKYLKYKHVICTNNLLNVGNHTSLHAHLVCTFTVVEFTQSSLLVGKLVPQRVYVFSNAMSKSCRKFLLFRINLSL